MEYRDDDFDDYPEVTRLEIAIERGKDLADKPYTTNELSILRSELSELKRDLGL